MISVVLDYTNKYYPCSLEMKEFNIVADGIEGTFSETYLVGQYINIQNSILNDGVYKITGVTSAKLTLDATLLVETNSINLFGLKLPTGLLSVISEIETYTAAQTTGADISSESQGNRSVTYANGGSAWQNVFKGKLTPYRAMYDDRGSYCSYNMNSKRWY